MSNTSKRIIDTSRNNRKGKEISLPSCYETFDTSKTCSNEIIDYFEQEYRSEDMKKEDNAGDLKNEESHDFGLCNNPIEVRDRSGENEVDIIKTEVGAKVSLKEMEWDEYSNKPRSFLLEEEMIEEEKILEQEKIEKEEIEVSNKKSNEYEMTMKTESIESVFLGVNIEITAREVIQPKPKPRKVIKKKHKKTKSEKDETKNTIKNFGKGIIIFVQKEVCLVSKFLSEIGSQMDHAELLKKLASVKNQLSRIQHLKELWTSEEYGREMRVISEFFLRKYTHSWIFNSRVENVKSPLKYRIRLLEAIQDPENFYSLKWV